MRATSYLKNIVSTEAVRNTLTPDRTDSHCPIPHAMVIDHTTQALQNVGLRVTDSAYELTHENNRMFGMMQIEDENNPEDYNTLIGIRNSHDKIFPAALAMGAQVMVCSNLSFSAEVVIARKHTRYILRDLQGLVVKAMSTLVEARVKQDQRIESYKRVQMSDDRVNAALIGGMEAGVFPARDIPKVLEEWRTPSHDEFTEDGNSVWRFFNAVTENLKRVRISEIAKRSQKLHGMCDSMAGVLN